MSPKRSWSRGPKSRRGQSLIEYALLLVLISGFTFAFNAFMKDEVFRTGLTELPRAVSPCLSHGLQASC
jgi:hypothetical protein